MITIPQAALASPDDKGEPVSPEVGDVVNLGGVQAKVTGVDGDNCTLEVESINGAKCIGEDGADDDEGNDESVNSEETGLPLSKDGAALFAKAMKADKRAGRV